MKKAVFGLASSEQQAERIVSRLLSAGFANEDISLLYPDKNKVLETEFVDKGSTIVEEREIKKPHGKVVGNLGTEKHTKAPEGGLTGALAGGILGGSLGLLAGIGALAIPGLGPFIAAGPLLGALSGSGIGGGLGLLGGSLIGAGIPEYEAKKFEAGLKAGNILISVHTNDSESLSRASDILEQEGATDIASSREKAA